ncbi:hypothetical protein GOARA_061_00220 [Gordonia araii NBRC 100433]|uniref:MalT-like TPR region domain-containing protein n=1 Tax=Gordonia araii NBRC 100433 TaxID=1073574 RepID=G7H408_9ACTN|nr:hypothetical protein [Gordonia araii]NNG96352.1 hypothetical protein [Gordonia araii NBRC 100433]GAB10583.1 hypothetical protein GOARA_061_00220 [Gordonia araii NBRC 100433]
MVQLDDDAIEVRRLVEVLAGQLQSGDAQWSTTLDRARTIADAVTDPRSRIDAQLRVANIDHVLSLNTGDAGGALAHLDRCLELIARAREFDDDEADRRRLNEQEWGVRLNRSQVLQTMDDIDGADADVIFALELASTTDNADRNRAMTLCSVAAIAVEREQWARALAFAREAVDECARHSPEALGVALLNLAQSHARIGDYDEATRVADRAEGVIDDIQTQAALAHLRGYIAMGRKDTARAAELFGEYAAAAQAHADLLEPHHRAESAKAVGFGLHAHDDVEGAREHYLSVVEQARDDASPMTLVAALVQASGATQDCALATTEPAEAARMHDEALGLIAEAAELALAQQRFTMAAVCDLTHVRYVDQFHRTVTTGNEGVLRRALAKVLAASVYLHHAAFASSRHAERRHFAAERSLDAFGLAFALAFRLGASDIVAQLVELRCATAFFSASRDAVGASGSEVSEDRAATAAAGMAELMAGDAPAPSVGVGPALVVKAPPPLSLTADTIVLGDAFDVAKQRYGLAEDRVPVNTW